MGPLNPDAPIFISRHHSASSTALLQSSDQNTNPRVSTYSHPFGPFYLQINQSPYGTSLYYACPPFPISSYPSYTFPWSEFQIYSLPSIPVFSNSQPSCSIEELNSDTEKTIAEEETVPKDPSAGVAVFNHKAREPKVRRLVVRAPHCQLQRWRRSTVKVEHRSFEISEDFDFENETRTSVMIKNIPNKFSKAKLISILNRHCCEENQVLGTNGNGAVPSEYDFFYLPIDFRTEGNFGYAFVNFTNPVAAWRLYKKFHNHAWSFAGSTKVCEVNYARIQGLSEHIYNADRLTFHSGIPDVFLPVHFEPPCNGVVRSVEHLHGRKLDSSF